MTPETKKAFVKEEPALLKEIKKIDEEASKGDLTEVKRKILKSKLESHISSKKDEIKRLTSIDRQEHERTELNIRSSLGRIK